MVVDDDEDEEEEKGDGEVANVTRPGVGHGILTQLGESERSRNNVTLSTSSSATCGQWQYATTAEGQTGGVFERQCHVEVVITFADENSLTHARAQTSSSGKNNRSPVAPCVWPHRKGKHPIYRTDDQPAQTTMSCSPAPRSRRTG